MIAKREFQFDGRVCVMVSDAQKSSASHKEIASAQKDAPRNDGAIDQPGNRSRSNTV
jgi:hypothetical protein